MSTALILLILVAAALHALWNFFAKKSGGSLSVLWMGALLSTIATLPVAIALQIGHPLSLRGLAIGIASGVVHCAYWWALARMYRRGDISLAYPVARGSGVLGTALGSMLLFREPLSFAGATGIASVCAGVFALGYQRRPEPLRTRVILLALLTGLTITGYTLLDDRGVQTLSPPVYLAVETGVGVLVLSIFGWRRIRRAAPVAYRRHRNTVWIIGIGSPLTYLIILYAFSLGPVSYISAVREFSVVIAALLGARFLHERIGWLRWTGIAMVVAGMVLIKLA
ncbi:MAG TPA: DMT family transporter [Candidatus Krumholzibacteria bacterium]